MFASKEYYKACIYTRLSKDDGDKPESDSIGNQKALIRDFVKNHPDIPYLMVTKPDFNYSRDDFQRRAIIMESYLKAFGNGDRQVYFVDGSTFFTGTEIGQCTVDGVHPTDDGFERMAKFIGEVIIKNADWEKMK